jgi:hypothetical protein
VTVPEQKGVAPSSVHFQEETIRAGAHRFGAFAARRSITPEAPVRSLAADLGRRQTLVCAVVPLLQVVAELDDLAEAG